MEKPVDSRSDGSTGIRKRIVEHYKQVHERDKQQVMALELKQLNRWLTIALAFLSTFYFLDVVSTLIAMNSFPGFVERNKVVAALFDRGFVGFLWAMALKYYPLMPVAVIIYLRPFGARSEIPVRVLKLGVLAGLVAGNFLYAFIVAYNASLLIGWIM